MWGRNHGLRVKVAPLVGDQGGYMRVHNSGAAEDVGQAGNWQSCGWEGRGLYHQNEHAPKELPGLSQCQHQYLWGEVVRAQCSSGGKVTSYLTASQFMSRENQLTPGVTFSKVVHIQEGNWGHGKSHEQP